MRQIIEALVYVEIDADAVDRVDDDGRIVAVVMPVRLGTTPVSVATQ